MKKMAIFEDLLHISQKREKEREREREREREIMVLLSDHLPLAGLHTVAAVDDIFPA